MSALAVPVVPVVVVVTVLMKIKKKIIMRYVHIVTSIKSFHEINATVEIVVVTVLVKTKEVPTL